MRGLAINRTKFHRPIGRILNAQLMGEVDVTLAMDGAVPLCFIAFLTPELRERLKACRVPKDQAALYATNLSNTKTYLGEGYKDFFQDRRGIFYVHPKPSQLARPFLMASMAHWRALTHTDIGELRVQTEETDAPPRPLTDLAAQSVREKEQACLQRPDIAAPAITVRPCVF